MSFDYFESARDALATLVDFGGAEPGVTLTRTPKAEYDRTTGKTVAADPVVTLGVGLVFDYGLHASGTGTVGSSLIAAGDRQLYLASLTVAGVEIPAPLKNDKCVAPDGVEYNVESVKTLAPAGVPVLYDVQLRR